MPAALALILVTAALLGQAPVERPSLAVMTLEAEQGVDSSTTRLLTDVLLQEVQATQAFSRVVSSRELESVLGLEKQRQLMVCTDESCVAEVAGALGVDMLITGAVGRLGDALLLNLRLINARSGLVLATRSQRLGGASEAALLDAMRPGVATLLHDAGIQAAALPATVDEPGGGPGPLLGVGLGGTALGLAGGLLGILGAMVGVATVVVPLLVYVPTPGLPGAVRVNVLPASGLGLAALGGLLMVAGILVTVASLAAAGVSILVR